MSAKFSFVITLLVCGWIVKYGNGISSYSCLILTILFATITNKRFKHIIKTEVDLVNVGCESLSIAKPQTKRN